ncbi:MAG: hypothetical protein ACE5D6_09430, partial [Candidatus Zixiibacteriota bacterium]
MKISSIPIKNKIEQITNRWKLYEPFLEVCHFIDDNQLSSIKLTGLNGSSKGIFIKCLTEDKKRPVLIITRNSETSNDIYDDLAFLLGEEKVGHFPSRQILPYDFRAPVGEIMGQRISTLSALLKDTLSVTFCPVRAFLEPTMAKNDLLGNSFIIRKGDEVNLDDLVKQLLKLGFIRVPNVEEVGDFALRGGLIDFFSPGAKAPVRIELFGDEIDTIRNFDVTSQRTIDRINQVCLLPKREIPITQETLETYLSRIPEEDADYIRSRYLNDPELPGLEWMSIMFGLKQGSILDYYNHNGIVFMEEEESLKAEADIIIEEARGLHKRLENQITALPTPEQYYHPITELFGRLNKYKRIYNLPFKGG